MTDLTDGTDLSDDEVGRRLAAARGYHRETQEQFALRINKNRETVKRYELGRFADMGRPGVIDRYVERTDLPRAFFAVDLKHLDEMVAAWQQVRAEAATPEEAVAAQEKDEDEILPPDSSESQNGEQAP